MFYKFKFILTWSKIRMLIVLVELISFFVTLEGITQGLRINQKLVISMYLIIPISTQELVQFSEVSRVSGDLQSDDKTLSKKEKEEK